MDVATDKEYLDWFYHTIRSMYKGVDGFEASMADRFKRERGLICPFYIKGYNGSTENLDSRKA